MFKKKILNQNLFFEDLELPGCVKTPPSFAFVAVMFFVVACLAYSFEVIEVERHARVFVVVFVKIDFVMHDLRRNDQPGFEASLAQTMLRQIRSPALLPGS